MPFALWLLLVLVSISVVGGMVLVLVTAKVEGAAIERGRVQRLGAAADLLQASITSSLSNFSRARRVEILEVVSPVIYSNPELDLMGLYRPSQGWGLKAWTRVGGEDALRDLLPDEVIEELIYSENLQTEYQNYFLLARPVSNINPETGHADVVAFLVMGQDQNLAWAELLPRVQALTTKLAILIVAQLCLVALFLNKALRKPIQRISNKTAEIEQEHPELSSEFSNLGDLARIEKSIDMLSRSRMEYRQQEAYLRAILATIKEAVLVLDQDIRIVEVNQEFVSIWGYAPDEIIGQPVHKILHSKHWEGFEQDIKEYKKTGTADHVDKVLRLDAVDSNGNRFPIDYVVSECVVGREKMFVVTLSDMREQERQTAELIEAKNNAEQAAAAKASFLANMSHEIRTPMNGVMGLLDLIGDSELDNQQSAMVRTAKVSAESLLNVLNDILDISKIEAGKIDLESTDFELDSVIEEVVTLFHVAAVDKGLELSCYIDPALDKMLLGDPTRIRQIASNIIGNAVKFTLEGEVDVRVEVISKRQDCCALEILVRDTGIGMSEKALKSLFDPFSQADSSTTRKFGGTGLGMAISRQLVELMNGKIYATSEPGAGTTFTVELVLPTSAQKKSSYKDSTELPETNILVVDDNATNRDVMAAYLTNWNIQFETASSAEAALELLHTSPQGRFDVCLTDYHMPDMDGIQLAQKIKELELAPNMVVALLSSGNADAKLMREAGIFSSMNKPVRQTQLFELIARCLDVKVDTIVAPAKAEQGLGGKVLLVEDNKVNQMVAQSLLEKMGLEVDLAVDGEKSLVAMQNNDYDLVLMDCLMPVMDGYEATTKRREYEMRHGLDRIPIIALTANAMSGDREKCLEAGMDDFLSKPIKVDEMREKLGIWLACSERQTASYQVN